MTLFRRAIQLHPYETEPAFENCPSATDIARWFTEEMRGVGNVGGDAWWLSRNPHGSCRMLAFVDLDTQEHYLLDIATEGTDDLLWVTYGLDGMWYDWWQHPQVSADIDHCWYGDGLEWLADKIKWFTEGCEERDGARRARPHSSRPQPVPRPHRSET